MRVLVTGSRFWTDSATIARALGPLADLPDPPTLVHGDARGADRLAAAIARNLNLATEAHPADWRRYGRGAGPVRNAEMLATLSPDAGDRVLAFHPDLSRSRGTADCVRQARALNIPVTIFTGDPADEPEEQPA